MGFLGNSALAEAIRGHDWALPALQSLHIVSIGALVSVILVTQLRAVGGLAREVPPRAILSLFRPWLLRSFAALLATGMLMIIAEPERTLTNVWFGVKLLLVIASLSAFRHQYQLAAADLPLSRPLAIFSLLAWLAVICCGRWIAYT